MEFTYEGRRYPVILERKRVKNINLHVRTDGSIYVSAAPRVPESVILDFLQKNAARIAPASDRIREKRQQQVLSDGTPSNRTPPSALSVTLPYSLAFSAA